MSVDQAHLMRMPALPAVPARRGHSQGVWLMPLAAGIFLGAMAFELLPAAASSLGWSAAAWAAGGAGLMALAGGRPGLSGARLAWMGSIGIWMHSLLEGMTAAAGFEAGTTVGILIAAVLIMHLLPEASALGAFSAQAGQSARWTVLRVAVTLALVATGFFVTRTTLPGLQAGQLSEAMGFAAGALGYLAVVTLRRSSSRAGVNLLGVLVGALWIAALHL